MDRVSQLMDECQGASQVWLMLWQSGEALKDEPSDALIESAAGTVFAAQAIEKEGGFFVRRAARKIRKRIEHAMLEAQLSKALAQRVAAMHGMELDDEGAENTPRTARVGFDRVAQGAAQQEASETPSTSKKRLSERAVARLNQVGFTQEAIEQVRGGQQFFLELGYEVGVEGDGDCDLRRIHVTKEDWGQQTRGLALMGGRVSPDEWGARVMGAQQTWKAVALREMVFRQPVLLRSLDNPDEFRPVSIDNFKDLLASARLYAKEDFDRAHQASFEKLIEAGFNEFSAGRLLTRPDARPFQRWFTDKGIEVEVRSDGECLLYPLHWGEDAWRKVCVDVGLSPELWGTTLVRNGHDMSVAGLRDPGVAMNTDRLVMLSKEGETGFDLITPAELMKSTDSVSKGSAEDRPAVSTAASKPSREAIKDGNMFLVYQGILEHLEAAGHIKDENDRERFKGLAMKHAEYAMTSEENEHARFLVDTGVMTPDAFVENHVLLFMHQMKEE